VGNWLNVNDLLEQAWNIIANAKDWVVPEGDSDATWLNAAIAWREKYFEYLKEVKSGEEPR
jgi:hypothetical protein